MGAHHGKPQSCAAVDDQLEGWESNYYPKGQKKVWENFWTELLMTVLQDCGFDDTAELDDLNPQEEVLLTGLPFVKMNSRSAPDEQSSVSQFFHILNSVDQQRGCCQVAEGKYEITIYTSCCNTDKGIYYYTTYNGHQISAVDMHKEDLDSAKLIAYPMITNEIINFQN